jgi:hypothetical protein
VVHDEVIDESWTCCETFPEGCRGDPL